MKKITEADSRYRSLEKMPVRKLLEGINREDHRVAAAIKKTIPEIERLVNAILPRIKKGGRIFYIGAGTSGRLGIVDASECPPTYGVDHGMIIGLIAGGDRAIRKAVEFAEDDESGAWKDLSKHKIGKNDTVIGIAASGSTPYVTGGLRMARERKILTGCITCNPGSPVTLYAHHAIVAVVGPEFVTGSTRMKSGTAQKMILNMISTAVMIRLGRVSGNKMVDMQLSNNKLIARGVRMISEKTGAGEKLAKKLLLQWGSVRKVLEKHKK
ncbi:MAG: N-acetylmuramic acid 6-phosphate etherase [Bacteroidia bacterium]|nr:N-acetylmuramic acid 6-phosphate etherase [Bacteroidia bacterium]